MDVHIVILAAGKGTRMQSALPKVLHRVAGRPMIDYVLDTADTLAPRTTTVVVGHKAEVLRAALRARPGLGFVVQEPQQGTAHALLTTESALAGQTGTLVLLSGDVPLLSAHTLATLVEQHRLAAAAATVVTAFVDNPHGYGRIVRLETGISHIVEDGDATPAQRQIREINSGIYAFDLNGLFESVRSIAAENAQSEYYLPDLVGIYRKRGLTVETVTVASPHEIQGVNSRLELATMTRAVRQHKNAELMAAGVTLDDPATTYVDGDVVVGTDTVLHPGVSLERGTVVGSGCEIHSGVRIVSSRIGDHTTVLDHCVITDSVVDAHAVIGPFAHLRNQASVGARAKVGNFVELKKTRLGDGSKSMHLAYLGDAVIGSNVNIGAGVITCNYDGTHKRTTTIEDGAFIGSDTQLIAPITVGEGAYVGTGTTVRENVPAGSLAVSAGKQRNIEGWVEGKKKRT
ncbi:MAG: UDP-N-acetylglucosamine diphosphorylase/glucosamine-1-phosphate N-acetyltransferase [Luteitalea sp.]|nr:UDP-N-acetylglucosamine diphosphorylase/glucosamine-1-phosphate N-acetyltransferase [Luteitalea sp.]